MRTALRSTTGLILGLAAAFAVTVPTGVDWPPMSAQSDAAADESVNTDWPPKAA